MGPSGERRRGPAERFRAKSVKMQWFLMIFEVSQRRGEEVGGTQWRTASSGQTRADPKNATERKQERSSREVQSEKC